MAGDDILANSIKLEDLEIGESTELEDLIQTETAKISLLKAKILRLDLAFDRISAATTETIANDLDEWHAQLPDDMQFASLQRDDLADEYRRSVYYIHLLCMAHFVLILLSFFFVLHWARKQAYSLTA